MAGAPWRMGIGRGARSGGLSGIRRPRQPRGRL